MRGMRHGNPLFMGSIIYRINCEESKIERWASSVGCEVGSLLFNYLGLPLGDNPKHVASWDLMIEKVHKLLASWKKTFFSKGLEISAHPLVLSRLPFILCLSLESIHRGIIELKIWLEISYVSGF